MHLNKQTENKFRQLVKDDRFAYFFDAVKNKPDDPDVEELINELTQLFAIEFNISWEHEDKIRYFLWLGYHAHR